MPRFLKAVFLQFFAIAGAGIFALPFVFQQSNFNFSLIFLVILTMVTGFLNFFYLEIVLNTVGDHQLSGYAKIYLGKNFRHLAALNLLLLGLGATVAYIKLFSNFLVILIPQLPLFMASLIFIGLLIISHILRFDFVRRLENIIPIIILLIPLLLFSAALQSPDPVPVIHPPNFSFFGPLIFALAGFTIIPEIEEVFRGRPKKYQSTMLASFLGLFLIFLVYLVFSFSVVRISGPYLSIDSITGIFRIYPWLGRILALFGMLITYQASLNFLLVIRELFYRDFHISKSIAQSLPMLVPLFGLILFTVPFIQIISLTGAITVYVSALIICAIRLKINYRWSTIVLSAIILLSLTFGLILEFG